MKHKPNIVVHGKTVQLPQDCFGTPTCSLFNCFGNENALHLFPQIQGDSKSCS